MIYNLLRLLSSMDLERSRPKGKIGGSSPPEGTWARGAMVAQAHGMREVRGSTPLGSTRLN